MSAKDNSECIEHIGIVQESGDGSAKVRITSASACSACHSKELCSLSGTEEKIIDITGSYNLSPGEEVTVQMKQSAGYTALFLGYILPLILVMAALIVLISSSVPELAAGICSIAILIPYYLIIWLFRKNVAKKFTFTIKA